MSFYADTSFLVSLYGSDAHSVRADLWRQTNPEPLPFTPLHRLECRNAIWLAVFQKRYSRMDADEVWRSVEVDVGAGLLILSNVVPENLWLDAEALVEPHTSETGARSLDVLHVAAAKRLAVQEFVTFDPRQAALASRTGLQLSVL